jgi:putative oxidoreductase
MASNSGGVTSSIGLLILRAGTAAMLLIGHGWPKLTHFGEYAAKFPDPIHVGPTLSLGLVVFAEVFCSIFVALGLFTRLAVVPIVIFLGVAFFIQHAHDPFMKKELALVFMVPFLTLLFTGAGRFALDSIVGPRKGGK